MSRLKIKDMPPVEVVDGTEIIPTGGKGDVSVTVERVKNYVLTAPILSSLQTDLNTVDLRSQNNKVAIDSHIADLLNPHQVTKAQVGLGNVDNTSDADKPLSTAAQTAITNLTNTKADVTYIDGLLVSKANITYVDAGLSTKLNATSNAVSASKLETARTISTTGDATWSTSFDGSTNATGILTLANSGVVANTYGNGNNVPQLTLDAKGRVTSASTVSIPTSSTTVSGLVQLNDTVSSTSTSLAATANSVKITYDLANTANTTANSAIPLTQKGIASGVATLDTNTLVPTTQLPQSTTTNVGVVEIATSAEVNTATDNTRVVTPSTLLSGVKNHLNVSGNAPMYACRAWVNFNGTGTVAIRASGNVSSITDNGVGDYTINFTSALPNSNYLVNLSRANGGASSGQLVVRTEAAETGTPTLKTTTQVRIIYKGGSTLFDISEVYASIVG